MVEIRLNFDVCNINQTIIKNEQNKIYIMLIQMDLTDKLSNLGESKTVKLFGINICILYLYGTAFLRCCALCCPKRANILNTMNDDGGFLTNLLNISQYL